MGHDFSSEVVLSILIVNFNGREFLGPCFDSIRKHATVPYEIIVVDNASHDGSSEYVTRSFPEINLITSKVNLGFAAGNNLAARSAKSKYLLLLNNDTLLLGDLKSAVALLSSDSSIGALGCQMRGRDNEYRYSAGYFPSPFRLFSFATIFNRSGPFKNGDFPAGGETLFYVDWVEGSFILTRNELWQSLGGMDEDYFMYVEDIDFCKRVNDHGLRVVYFPSLSFLHYGGYSINRLGMLIKGFRRYHRKFSNGIIQLAANCILTFGLILKAVVYVLFSLGRGHGVGVKGLSCLKAIKDSPW
jgi:GT2 family glycosyltransferase